MPGSRKLPNLDGISMIKNGLLIYDGFPVSGDAPFASVEHVDD
jgi:hypothetical protein